MHKETYGVFYQLAEHKAVAKRVLDTLCAAVEFKHEVTQRATDGEELKAVRCERRRCIKVMQRSFAP